VHPAHRVDRRRRHLLWYAVVAWDERFGGSVIDYGPYPDQGRDYFAAADARPGLGDLPGDGRGSRRRRRSTPG
jgi:hypothetical protein